VRRASRGKRFPCAEHPLYKNTLYKNTPAQGTAAQQHPLYRNIPMRKNIPVHKSEDERANHPEVHSPVPTMWAAPAST
jgi:hypothetical protein